MELEFFPCLVHQLEELDRNQGDPPARRKWCGNRVKRGSDSEAPNTAIVVGKPEHGPGASFSFIPEGTGQTTHGMLETHLMSPYRMSPLGCTNWVEAEDFSMAGELILELDAGWLLLKRPRSLVDDSKETTSYVS
ncbi:hypothetical protein JCGZ_10621 [Jatropha curcas]|uniref:Uncharacterized protein n=1 Tax=Jatropha curcas TaxID=180498 RepID=A0A067KI86_JATCU|nr:hypothetical protein JCGZ_10621 [Jatropha curcas]